MPELIVIGGGLAGCEAAFQAAERGIDVTLYEMRPNVSTPAHSTGNLAELVCSNSLGSLLPDRASGLLINELTKLNSLLVNLAKKTSVPSGSSLSVDREAFSKNVEEAINTHTRISVIHEELQEIPSQTTIIATGPLTSPCLSKSLMNFTGHQNLFFYDAVAPIVYRDSIDFSIAFPASRFASEKGETADYINCPLSHEEFDSFVAALVSAKRIPLKTYEEEIDSGVKGGKGHFFEGCLPIEVIASRGARSLAFGPMRPIGLMDPRTNQRPHAVLQLRQENLAASLYNMVGFQTNLTFTEQKRIFRMVPGLENAEFARMGQMHRNTYLCSPNILQPTFQTQIRPDLFLAGQITGIEGYLGNIASGLLAGINAANYLSGKELCIFPTSTLLGALCRYITESPEKSFQPMKANFGLLPELKNRFLDRLGRAGQYVETANSAMDTFLKENSILLGLS
jgi:methylenetetrahydrofolate--tRNA-(uracil-5-)-methyltransferase